MKQPATSKCTFEYDPDGSRTLYLTFIDGVWLLSGDDETGDLG